MSTPKPTCDSHTFRQPALASEHHAGLEVAFSEHIARLAHKPRIAIITARFNTKITEALRTGALNALLNAGIPPQRIHLSWAPGAVELPLLAQQALNTHYDAAICLGCVIRGETDHYHYVCNMVSQGLMQVSLNANKPAIFGLLTCDNHNQALARIYEINENAPQAITPIGNKGREAAEAALEMLCTLPAFTP